VIAALGPAGYLVNIARGSLVDEDACWLRCGRVRLRGAGLDVFEREPHDGSRWRDIETAVLTPHNGGGADLAIAEIRRMCIVNVTAYLKGEPLLTPLF
jgi:phosphoglycerate dehydrogenase-like enzyme